MRKKTICISVTSTTGWKVGDLFWIDDRCAVIDELGPMRIIGHKAGWWLIRRHMMRRRTRKIRDAILRVIDILEGEDDQRGG